MTKNKIDLTKYKKILVLGCSCSGKTTFSKKLSETLNIQHIELDQYYWLDNWKSRDEEQFQNIVFDKLKDGYWIVDGNYRRLRDTIWNDADVIIWLNYNLSLILYSALLRSFQRIFFKKTCCNNNTETLTRTLFTKKSIFYWILKTYKQRKIEYNKMFHEENKFNFIEFKTRKELNLFLSSLEKQK